MKSQVIVLDPARENAEQIAEIAAVLRAGGIMAYPTETYYGLGAAAFASSPVKRIFRMKGRDPDKPLSLVASDMEMVREITAELPALYWILAERFWPGPLTLVLKASPALPVYLAGPGGSVAVRIPPPAWIRRLANEISQPLTATSANLSGAKEIADPAEVTALFSGAVDLIVDGGRTPGGAPSTIVDLTGDKPRVLREGIIPAAEIAAVFNS